MLILVNVGALLLPFAVSAAIFLFPRPKSAIGRALIAVAIGWVVAVLYAGLIVNPVGIEAAHAVGEHFPEARYDNNTIASAIVGGWLAPLLSVSLVTAAKRIFFRQSAPINQRTPNNALDAVAPGPSRPLQLSGKGRAGLRRAGQRKR